jgi:hypothetical protein
MSNASSEEIESFSAYEVEEDINIDATIILGDYVESATVPHPEYVLILMRFHKLSRHSNIKPGVSRQLYNEIMKVCGRMVLMLCVLEVRLVHRLLPGSFLIL